MTIMQKCMIGELCGELCTRGTLDIVASDIGQELNDMSFTANRGGRDHQVGARYTP